MIFTFKLPGQTLGQLTKNVQEKSKKKICFLGRLDPMASGIVCYFTDTECRLAKKYQHVDKTYKFNLVLGMSTDSGDPLGLLSKVINITEWKKREIMELNFMEKFSNFEYEQIYPRFSSYVIKKDGMKKPLWFFTKYGNQILKEELPKHKVKIYILEQIDKSFWIENTNYFIEDISKLNDGNLRKEEIIQQYLGLKNIKLLVFPLIAKVSSGTYIRQLCEDIGAYLNLPAMADKIERVSYHFPSENGGELDFENYEIFD